MYNYLWFTFPISRDGRYVVPMVKFSATPAYASLDRASKRYMPASLHSVDKMDRLSCNNSAYASLLMGEDGNREFSLVGGQLVCGS